jgi:hypothetical protein
VALITVLVLFIAALSEGLAAANREYIEKLNGELLVFQEGTELSTTASRIGRSEINAIAPGRRDRGSWARLALPAPSWWNPTARPKSMSR